MNQDDIIRLADDAGLIAVIEMFPSELYRFFDLAQAAERKRCRQLIGNYELSVDHKAAGPVARAWTFQALEEIKDEIATGNKAPRHQQSEEPIVNEPPFYTFMSSPSKEVMRISSDGVTVAPDIPLDTAAKTVIDSVSAYIKRLIEQEREECAKLCLETEPFYGQMFAEEIRARGSK